MSTAGARAFQPSNSLLGCFLAVKARPDVREALRGRNVWWHDVERADYLGPDMTATPRMLYVGSPTANGVAAGLGDGATEEGLVVFAPGNFAQEAGAAARGEAAREDLRGAVLDAVLGTLERELFPGLRRSVLHAVLLTPLDVARQTGAEAGNAYGRRLTAEQLSSATIDPGWPENLVLGSASVGMPGIATGFRTAAAIVERLTGEAV
jgi:phytoene dehydrogenase-like protein